MIVDLSVDRPGNGCGESGYELERDVCLPPRRTVVMWASVEDEASD